jgi:hypothetical protein
MLTITVAVRADTMTVVLAQIPSKEGISLAALTGSDDCPVSSICIDMGMLSIRAHHEHLAQINKTLGSAMLTASTGTTLQLPFIPYVTACDTTL